MRLDDFQQEDVRRLSRYVVPITDEAGNEAYELLILGPEQRVQETFAESDIDVAVRPDVAEEEWREEAQRALAWEDQVYPRSAFDDPAGWAKPPRPQPSAEDRVLVALNSTRPGGTGLTLQIRNLTLFGSVTLGLVPPRRMAWVGAQVRPFSGDPDLSLSVGGASGFVAGIFSSTAPGLLWDTVWAQIIYGISLPFFPTVDVVPFLIPSSTLFIFWGWVM